MWNHYEYPKIYTTSQNTVLPILKKPVIWSKSLMTDVGQLYMHYKYVKSQEDRYTNIYLTEKQIKGKKGNIIKLGISGRPAPKIVLLYLHTVFGNYKQMSIIADIIKNDNIAYVSYSRSGHEKEFKSITFNLTGGIDELNDVLDYINLIYPGVPIHCISASAGGGLLIKYLGGHNQNMRIQSGMMISPGYDFLKIYDKMISGTRSFMVNKIKYILGKSYPNRNDIKAITNMDEFVKFQAELLGYSNIEDFVRTENPINYLKTINAPSLFLNALDDPLCKDMVTSEYLSLPLVNKNIIIAVTTYGGHVCFFDKKNNIPWSLRVMHEWIKAKIE
jgi:predicted alpha/beta-fold hydrolase